MTMKLENQRLCVEISEMGAEITRIYDKKNDAELLWEGNPTYCTGLQETANLSASVKKGIPSLFFLRPARKQKRSILLILN